MLELLPVCEFQRPVDDRSTRTSHPHPAPGCYPRRAGSGGRRRGSRPCAARTRAASDGRAARQDTLTSELAHLDAELARYADAIADGGPLETILQAVKVREQRRDAIRTELKTLPTQRRAEPRDTSQIRAALLEYLENWRAVARQGVTEARGLLRAVLVGHFVFTSVTPPQGLPPRKGPGRKPRFIYGLKGEASLSGLIAGLISASSVVAPTGFEPVFQSRSRFRL